MGNILGVQCYRSAILRICFRFRQRRHIKLCDNVVIIRIIVGKLVFFVALCFPRFAGAETGAPNKELPLRHIRRCHIHIKMGPAVADLFITLGNIVAVTGGVEELAILIHLLQGAIDIQVRNIGCIVKLDGLDDLGIPFTVFILTDTLNRALGIVRTRGVMVVGVTGRDIQQRQRVTFVKLLRPEHHLIGMVLGRIVRIIKGAQRKICHKFTLRQCIQITVAVLIADQQGIFVDRRALAGMVVSDGGQLLDAKAFTVVDMIFVTIKALSCYSNCFQRSGCRAGKVLKNRATPLNRAFVVAQIAVRKTGGCLRRNFHQRMTVIRLRRLSRLLGRRLRHRFGRYGRHTATYQN